VWRWGEVGSWGGAGSLAELEDIVLLAHESWAAVEVSLLPAAIAFGRALVPTDLHWGGRYFVVRRLKRVAPLSGAASVVEWLFVETVFFVILDAISGERCTLSPLGPKARITVTAGGVIRTIVV
jgi:hypothetical protein